MVQLGLYVLDLAFKDVGPPGSFANRAAIIKIAVSSLAGSVARAESTFFCGLGCQHGTNSLADGTDIMDIAVLTATTAISRTKRTGFWSVMYYRLDFDH